MSASLTRLCLLDLRASGLSAIERLCLEEAILRHDPLQRSWAILGTHEPLKHRFLQHKDDATQNCIIVMGISGKPDQLLDIPTVKRDRVTVLKRFSGGGTVVLDPSSLWTTFIGRTAHFPDVESYPTSIMRWSADAIFGPSFRCMNASTSSSDTPEFQLRENDYVLGPRKMGGNAQSIIKGGWLHHTSFLWDYDQRNMEYLSLPSKRPDYRGDRSHDEFLVKLNQYYGTDSDVFFDCLRTTCEQSFDVAEVSVAEAMEVVDGLGGMQQWFEKSRTRIVAPDDM